MQIPNDLTPDLLAILGRPNFRCADLAHLMRASGTPIAAKAEAEQAHVLFALLRLYSEHGEKWREEARQWIKALAEEAKTKLGEPK